MKKILTFLLLMFSVGAGFAATATGEVLEYKGKIGFTSGEDKIVDYKFLDNDRKVLIIGLKSLQLWSVEDGRLLNSVTQDIPQFAPRGFVGTYLLLGLPKALDWRPFIIDDKGKWIITAEKVGANVLRSAVVRDLQTLKQIAVLNMPDVSTEYVAFDRNKDEILTFGITDKTGAFAGWNKNDFTVKELSVIKEYKWHRKIRDDGKMIVGSGDTKVLWSGANVKQGDALTLRDVKTGAIEKEFTAPNLKPETSFQETTVSADENYLVSKRDDRVFVWAIDGSGAPKFEISQPNPKGDFSFKKIVDRRFIVVKIDGRLRVYDIEGKGAPLLDLAPRNEKEDFGFLEIINKRYVVVKVNSRVRVYDHANNALKYEIAAEDSKDTAEYRGASDNGRFIAVCDDRKVSVFETAGDRAKAVYQIVRSSEKERFPTVRFLNDEHLLAIARVNKSEKKEPRTEFYDTTTGRLIFAVGFQANYTVKFTPDKKNLYQTDLGSFKVWNLAAGRLTVIPLETHTPNHYDFSTNETVEDTPENSEFARFSPDYRYILRYGDDVTAIFDTETGARLQTIFDFEKVRYNKQNQIKKSGLGEAGWIKSGRYVYALESGNFLGGAKALNLWQVKK